MAGEEAASTSRPGREAVQRAATARERAAEVHEAAAGFFAANGHPDRAQRHRAAALRDVAEARTERDPPTASDAEPPLDRLVAIHERVEGIRAAAASIGERLGRTVDASQAARDRSAAHARVTQLRHDLEQALKEAAGLRTAMETRGVIEQAKGMIMTALKVDGDAAFEVLVRRSETSHQKLVDVARGVVETGRRASPGSE